jgi:hypothetical protein
MIVSLLDVSDSESDEYRRRRLFMACGFVAFFQLLGFVAIYIYSAYFQKSALTDSLLFRPADNTSVAEGFVRPAPLGIHYFGDFMWSFSQMSHERTGGYFGASQIIHFVLANLPMMTALLVIYALTVICVAIACCFVMPRSSFGERLVVSITLFFGTYPILLALDRGQIHVLLIGMLILGMSLVMTSVGRPARVGGFIVGAAVSMKVIPIFFLIFLLRKRHRHAFRSALLGVIGCILLPLTFLRDGVGFVFQLFGFRESRGSTYMDSLYLSEEYFEQSRAANVSFKAFFEILRDSDWFIHPVGGFLFDNYFLVAAIFATFCAFMIISKRVTELQALSLCAIGSCRLIPIAGGYTVGVFLLIAFFYGLMTERDTKEYGDRLLLIGAAISVMPLQIGLGFGQFQSTSYTFASLVGPITSLALLTQIFGNWLMCSFSARNHSVLRRSA